MQFAYLLQSKQLAFICQLIALGRTRRNSAGASTSNWLAACCCSCCSIRSDILFWRGALSISFGLEKNVEAGKH
ncbi:putative serine/threonine-protein kinase [Trichinella pseudospiralis]